MTQVAFCINGGVWQLEELNAEEAFIMQPGEEFDEGVLITSKRFAPEGDYREGWSWVWFTCISVEP